jgi:hypothetical protein
MQNNRYTYWYDEVNRQKTVNTPFLVISKEAENVGPMSPACSRRRSQHTLMKTNYAANLPACSIICMRMHWLNRSLVQLMTLDVSQ